MPESLAPSLGYVLGLADWSIIGLYLAGCLAIGVYFERRNIRTADDMLIAGRNLPWWVIGISNVATYSDCGAVWVWILFLGGTMYMHQIAWISWPIWMPLVAIFWAKLWRRSRLVTTGELIEFRYSGKWAGRFRGVFGVYACLVWGVVLLGYGAKLLAQVLAPIVNWDPFTIVLVFGGLTLGYTLMSGLYAAAYLDVPQFLLFFLSAFAIVMFGLGEQGGYAQVLERAQANRPDGFWEVAPPVAGSAFCGDTWTLLALVLLGFFLPGSPYAGDGWTAQRMLAAKDERHAALGQMFNCVLSIVVRFIPVMFMSVLAVALFVPAEPGNYKTLVTPEGEVHESVDAWALLVLRYADRMPGLVGLLIAAALAGYMSSVDSFLNWSSSFFINDVYRRHLRPRATEGEYLKVTRLTMIVMMILATCIAANIEDAEPWVLFMNMALIVPALPLAWLRWFWWRTNVWGEIFGVLISAPLAYYVWFVLEWREPFWQPTFVLLGAGLAGSLACAFLFGPESRETLRRFYLQVRPPGFWGPVRAELAAEGLIDRRRERREFFWDVLAALSGIAFCYATLFFFLYAVMLKWSNALPLGALALFTGFGFIAFWLKSRQAAEGAAPEKESHPFEPVPAVPLSGK